MGKTTSLAYIKSKNNKSIILLAYILLGIYIYSLDTSAAIMYVTVLPLQILFLFYGIKSRNILLLIFFLEMFLAQGINPIFFFLDRDKFSPTGFSAIGTYDFSLSRYYSAYSYIFVFCLTMVVVDHVFLKRKRKQDLLLPYMRKLTYKLQNNENTRYLTYMIVFTILMSTLSIWMYSNGIGVLGLKVVRLPFHLTGILVSFRRYIASIVMVYFFFKCKPKSFGYVVLVIYGVIMSVSGCSKSIAAITFFPLIFYYFIEKHYTKATIAIVLYGFIYSFVTASRSFTYETAEISYSFMDLLEISANFLSSSDSNFFVSFLSSVSGRFYGSNVIVLMDQQHITSFSDLLLWYFTGKYNFSIIDMHGFSLDQPGFENFAFGIGVGIPGFLVLLSCHNFLYTIFQAIIIVLLHHYFNSNLQHIFAAKPKTIIIMIVCGIMGLAVQNMWNAGPYITEFYLCLLALIIIRFIYSKRKRDFSIR